MAKDNHNTTEKGLFGRHGGYYGGGYGYPPPSYGCPPCPNNGYGYPQPPTYGYPPFAYPYSAAHSYQSGYGSSHMFGGGAAAAAAAYGMHRLGHGYGHGYSHGYGHHHGKFKHGKFGKHWNHATMKTESFTRPKSWERVVIAMKGLPCTGKTRVANQIGNWAERPVLSIDDFIDDNNNNDDADIFQATRALEQAFVRLCKVARSQLNSGLRCVVIKSRLSSIFELEQLFELVGHEENWALLIVECRVRNKHQWQRNFSGDDHDYSYERKWYRPGRWNDIEKARDDHYNDPQALAQWDRHLLHLIQVKRNWFGPPLVSRLVVDPSYDLDLKGYTDGVEINPIFVHAINHHLVSSSLRIKWNGQNYYEVEFDELRRSRAKEVLNPLTPISTRSKDVCGESGCLFKYSREELQVDDNDNCCCVVCEKKLVSGQPAYTCHYCIFTLHKPCAEEMTARYQFIGYDIMYKLPASEKHACKNCQEFNEYCKSCCFQTVLKGRLLPLVINHDHHPHPLSLRIEDKWFACKACGVVDYCHSYVCGICEWYYHSQCVYMPREVKHEHGGHEHVLKLKNSHDDKEQEDYWCDVCFQDLDPYFWYYSCQSFPYYAAHLCCVGVFRRGVWPESVT